MAAGKEGQEGAAVKTLAGIVWQRVRVVWRVRRVREEAGSV